MALMTGAAEGVIKTDVLGRLRTSAARRERLLEEFDRSGLSGPKFAALVGVKYQTFATWLQKRRRQGAGQVKAGGASAPASPGTKRLEEGTFSWPKNLEPQTTKLCLTPQALAMLTDGVDLRGAKLRPWYERCKSLNTVAGDASEFPAHDHARSRTHPFAGAMPAGVGGVQEGERAPAAEG